jgi:hypothetical protein
MTTRANVGSLILNAVIGMIATLFVLFGTGAWSLKENVSAHNADISAMRAGTDSVRSELRESTQRILDAICNAQDVKRVCR